MYKLVVLGRQAFGFICPDICPDALETLSFEEYLTE